MLMLWLAGVTDTDVRDLVGGGSPVEVDRKPWHPNPEIVRARPRLRQDAGIANGEEKRRMAGIILPGLSAGAYSTELSGPIRLRGCRRPTPREVLERGSTFE